MAPQTVTFFWVLSDFLSANERSLDITAELIMKQGADESGLERLAADWGRRGSDAALWMLLLLRLTSVTTDERLELRNSAIQTLVRIFDAYGDRLGAEAWSACVESVIFRLLSSLEAELKAADGGDVAESERAEWHGTAVVVLDGISDLLANYLDVLTTHQSFNRLWRELLEHFTGLLGFQVLDINTATFKALTHILSHVGDEKRSAFDEASIESVWDLWSRGIPTSKRTVDPGARGQDNQGCLIAFVAALCKVYTLLQGSMTAERIKKMLKLLRETVQEASTDTYALDVEHPTPLQTHVLAAVQMVRTDVDGVPSAIVNQVSEFVVLAYEKGQAGGNAKRTFVAMSKESMKMLQGLVSSHASVKDVYTSGALANALSALSKPIALKYRFPIVTKSSPPWRMATSAALEVLGATLPQLAALHVPKETVQSIWAIIVAVADGILGADAEGAPAGLKADDEDFDVASFRKLRALIIPSLGGDAVEDKTRRAYAESLFRTSMIHGVSAAERLLVEKQGDGAGVASLHALPPGRTTAVAPTGRMRMAYVSFDELFSLVSAGWGDVTESSPSHVLRVRIASAAAPLLILRCALTMRAYAADQPLRGKMPQPLSQRKELLWTLRKLVELESKAMPGSGGGRHVRKLYPLIVRSLEVEGDGEVQKLLREALGVIGKEWH